MHPVWSSTRGVLFFVCRILSLEKPAGFWLVSDREHHMYRVVFFGEPGSGKTTLSARIAKELGLPVVEASQEVIFPVAALKTLPKEEELIAYLAGQTASANVPVSREIARRTFSALRETYGGEIIAKVLHAKFVEVPQKESCIFSGLRGLDNARFCRLHNDLVIYLTADRATLGERLQQKYGTTAEEAVKELIDEQTLFQTSEIANVADLVVDTSLLGIDAAVAVIRKKIDAWTRMCTRCVNVAKNPAMKFNENGLCHICEAYLAQFDPNQLTKELEILNGCKRNTGHDVMVGISGGKDSTSTLYQIKKMGFNPLAFTFDTGYLPETTIPRSQAVARKLGVAHEVIDIRRYLQKIDIETYERLADLYDLPFTLETKQIFRDAYEEGRKHYSITCAHATTFVRSCQICRRMVIRAYHGEATARGIGAVVLGMNEWTNLSASQSDTLQTVSGMRVLQPSSEQSAVTVFHVPFLLRRTIADVERDLAELAWDPPAGENLIESNSNSCLLARSTEYMAKRLLEFHPDSTRLAREVTVGFLSKEQALAALGKIHPYQHSPREVLKKAGIL